MYDTGNSAFKVFLMNAPIVNSPDPELLVLSTVLSLASLCPIAQHLHMASPQAGCFPKPPSSFQCGHRNYWLKDVSQQASAIFPICSGTQLTQN